MPAIRKLVLSLDERVELEGLLQADATSRRLAMRVRIVLAAAEGLNNERIARCCGCNVNTARLWRNRWLENGLEGLRDTPGRGRKKVYTREREAEILAATLESPAPLQRWTARRLGRKLGVPRSTILRVWQRHGVRPQYRPNDEPLLVETVVDLVGLLLEPRANAAALRVHHSDRAEVPQDRPASSLPPMAPQKAAPDDEPRVPMELLAALNAAAGEPEKGHRYRQFLGFLESIDERYPEGEIHLILTRNGHAVHEHPRIRRWLARRPRYHPRCSPSSASWIHQVDTWFGLLTRQTPPGDGFNSVSVLTRAVDLFKERWNPICEPFEWVKTGERSLLEALLARFHSPGSERLDRFAIFFLVARPGLSLVESGSFI